MTAYSWTSSAKSLWAVHMDAYCRMIMMLFIADMAYEMHIHFVLLLGRRSRKDARAYIIFNHFHQLFLSDQTLHSQHARRPQHAIPPSSASISPASAHPCSPGARIARTAAHVWPSWWLWRRDGRCPGLGVVVRRERAARVSARVSAPGLSAACSASARRSFAPESRARGPSQVGSNHSSQGKRAQGAQATAAGARTAASPPARPWVYCLKCLVWTGQRYPRSIFWCLGYPKPVCTDYYYRD